jgi:hypothetical protein
MGGLAKVFLNQKIGRSSGILLSVLTKMLL